MEATLPRTAAGRALRALARVPAPPIEGLLAPLDRARSHLLRALAPRFRALVVDREKRVAITASCMLLSALAFSTALPIWLAALGPIVWGVPHVLSDVRYLVARPGFHRRPWVLLAMAGGIAAAGLGFGLRGGLAGAAAAIVAARGASWRRGVGLAVVGAAFALAVRYGWTADVVFAHLHNAVGLGLWWAWRRRASRLHWVPLAIVAAGAALILAGAFDPVVRATGGLSAPWTDLSLGSLASMLTPVRGGPWPARMLVLYVFGQAAHYAVWLRLVPEDDRPSPTPRSYTQSFRALQSDVGALVLWAALASALVFALWATVSVGEARNGYIQAAFFHGYLELAAAAVLWVEDGWRSLSPRPPARA